MSSAGCHLRGELSQKGKLFDVAMCLRWPIYGAYNSALLTEFIFGANTANDNPPDAGF